MFGRVRGTESCYQLPDWIKAYFHETVGRTTSYNRNNDAMEFMNQLLIEQARLSVNKKKEKDECRNTEDGISRLINCG